MENQMPKGQVVPVNIGEEMRSSYLDYAVSVIVERALPDVRDGLKPVHRRILYAMHDLGMGPSTPYKKSARVTGEVIGKYHPHGDIAVYDAAVKMAQPWSKRVPLVDGQGNFGSQDGDNPAAMRYTEMRLTRAGQAFFDDLDKDTVNFRPNYDGEEREPEILPVSYPNIWVNGTDGIAVGMATLIVPHNLNETIEAFLAFMDNPDISTDDILRIMPGPDFPTGGVVYDLDGFREAIETGRGRVRVRAKWHSETKKNGQEILILDDVPYQTNKKVLVETIAEKVKLKEIEDISDVRDETNKNGIRVVIELKKGAIPAVVFNHLVAKKTGVESAFSYNMMLLDGQQPFLMNLRHIFTRFLEFRKEVIVRRIRYMLQKAEARLHILVGLMAALQNMNAVIELVRSTRDPKTANEKLQALLSIDELQAQAILDLKLQRLTGMELESIRDEHDSVHAKVVDYRDILANDARIIVLIKEDLVNAKQRFGEDRRTEISYESNRVNMADLVKKEPCIIHRTKNGYVKRMPAENLGTQNRNTKGKNGILLDDDDYVEAVYTGCTHDMFMVFTESGRTFARRVWQLPEGGASSRGRHLRNLFEDLDEPITHLLFVPEMEIPGLGIVTVTANGKVKRTPLDEYQGALRRNGVQGLSFEDGDRLIAAVVARSHDHMMLASSGGRAIRFEVSDDSIRECGRTSVGVRGMRLEDGEYLVGAMVIPGNGSPLPIIKGIREETGEEYEDQDTSSMDKDWFMLSVGANGVGKRTPVSEFRVQSRAGKGVNSFNINKKTGPIVKAMLVREDEDLVLNSAKKTVRIRIADVRVSGRVTAGSFLMDVGGDILVGAVTTPPLPEEAITQDSAE